MYPGEPLPRWQYGLFWRTDGYPVWKNIDLIAHEKIEKKYTAKDAEAFINELTKHLALSVDTVSPAYEDVFYFLWTEGKIPANIDPLKKNLKDPLERKTLAELLDKSLGEPIGYVLPIEWNYWNNKWLSYGWKFGREYLFLVPGNSPMGLRLPLDSLPVVKQSKKNTGSRTQFV
ncbi:MAG: transglutaminase family protein [Ferruginibacter sp.]